MELKHGQVRKVFTLLTEIIPDLDYQKAKPEEIIKKLFVEDKIADIAGIILEKEITAESSWQKSTEAIGFFLENTLLLLNKYIR